uniref:Cleft lip and palate associated transmembrane protein n=2 Tax=Guillardia theta TaxID=55529 RepID=A0A7S4KMJ4_GUITH|mmetsp:Transcript_27357/g.89285  ORF Transcript_27357/g.89285 Transcript_27357/m.89285 type:complete len:502 (+) Transcript_27357:386-1891(+)
MSSVGLNVQGKGALIWHEKNLFLNSAPLKGNTRLFNRSLTKNDLHLPWHNQSVFAHVYFVRNGADPLGGGGNADVAHGVFNLISHAPRPKAKKTKNLITGDMSERDQEIMAANAKLNITEERENEIIPMWKPEIYIDIVEETSVFPGNGIPQPMLDHMKFDSDGSYFPIMHLNEFWLTKGMMIHVNETVDHLPLVLHFRCQGRFTWLMVIQWGTSMQQQRSIGTASEGDHDELKRILLESNPYLLAITGIVSLLHTVFDFLAFKNDISFWRKVDSMQGLSVRSIFTNIITQTIIFLYLLDNDTSWLILLSSGVGLLIEIWKVKKAMNVLVLPQFPFIKLNYKDSYKSETMRYDQIAMKYLSYVLYPLSLGFSIYSLMYNQHKSWWSWILSSAVGCVYTFGFIMMTPQLFINYKLKSVAHLPWRAMIYKFLNTIIDDLFAFVIKMPTLHRLSVFRDDLIFLIYLYQRWTYRVDKKRPNEYGMVAKDAEESTQDPAQPQQEKQ